MKEATLNKLNKLSEKLQKLASEIEACYNAIDNEDDKMDDRIQKFYKRCKVDESTFGLEYPEGTPEHDEFNQYLEYSNYLRESSKKLSKIEDELLSFSCVLEDIANEDWEDDLPDKSATPAKTSAPKSKPQNEVSFLKIKLDKFKNSEATGEFMMKCLTWSSRDKTEREIIYKWNGSTWAVVSGSLPVLTNDEAKFWAENANDTLLQLWEQKNRSGICVTVEFDN